MAGKARRSAKRNPGQINHKPNQAPHEESAKNAAVDRRKTEAAMRVEIIERKPTTIVTFSIANAESGAAIALAAVAVGLVAFVLLLIREFNAWASDPGSLD